MSFLIEGQKTICLPTTGVYEQDRASFPTLAIANRFVVSKPALSLLALPVA
jgi:hypothetical protein